MPLFMLRPFIRTMFNYDPSVSPRNGYIRIGGTPASGDPFIDVKVFSNSLVGTTDAIFGVSFDRDLGHRDFACNALYYDPINNVLIDPSGFGFDDAMQKRLRLVCCTGAPAQHAKIFIRAIKFHVRGFTMTAETLSEIRSIYASSLTALSESLLVEYVRAQLWSKSRSLGDKRTVLGQFNDALASLEMYDAQVRCTPAVTVLQRELNDEPQ
jgi:hypothetical protein